MPPSHRGAAPLLEQVRFDCGVEVLRNDTDARDAAILLVPGAGGGLESPAGDLYGFLAQRMQEHGTCTLQLRHKEPANLVPCTSDVIKVVEHLRAGGTRRFAFVGWSFGGAVVLQAASQVPESIAVVTVATQSYGAEAAAHLPEQCSVLLLHGAEDEVLPPQCSIHVFQQIPGDRKEIVLYPNATHALSEVAHQVHQKVYQFLFLKLRETAPSR